MSKTLKPALHPSKQWLSSGLLHWTNSLPEHILNQWNVKA